jgi:hypothetical protein
MNCCLPPPTNSHLSLSCWSIPPNYLPLLVACSVYSPLSLDFLAQVCMGVYVLEERQLCLPPAVLFFTTQRQLTIPLRKTTYPLLRAINCQVFYGGIGCHCPTAVMTYGWGKSYVGFVQIVTTEVSYGYNSYVT